MTALIEGGFAPWATPTVGFHAAMLPSRVAGREDGLFLRGNQKIRRAPIEDRSCRGAMRKCLVVGIRFWNRNDKRLFGSWTVVESCNSRALI